MRVCLFFIYIYSYPQYFLWSYFFFEDFLKGVYVCMFLLFKHTYHNYSIELPHRHSNQHPYSPSLSVCYHGCFMDSIVMTPDVLLLPKGLLIHVIGSYLDLFLNNLL